MDFQLVHIPQTESTNIHARHLLNEENITGNFCVTTPYQIAGKGQLGASWQSEKAKNITISLGLQNLNLEVHRQFELSALVSLNLIKALQNLGFFKIQLKWPNDIISNNYKIAGILIETIIQNSLINTAVIGIGLNVNQTEFIHLPKASSLKSISGIHYNLDEILHQILVEMQKIPTQLNYKNSTELYEKYHQYLFRKDKASMFEFPSGTRQPGIIKGVKKNGSLRIIFEDDLEQNFDVKEINLLY